MEREKWAQVLIYFVVAIGLLTILALIWEIFRYLNRHILRPLISCCRPSLITKYGGVKGTTWVLVTGGTDGIGLEFCR